MSTDVVTYRPVEKPNRRANRIMLALWLLLAAACVVLAAISGRWFMLLVQIPGAGAAPWWQWWIARRTYRADAAGIHARPVMEAPWSTIESVKKPTQWDVSTMVRMRGTGEERSSGFPTSYAERLAQIGDRPLT